MGMCASAPKEKDLPPSKSKVHHQVSRTMSPPKNISHPELISRGNEVGKPTFPPPNVLTNGIETEESTESTTWNGSSERILSNEFDKEKTYAEAKPYQKAPFENKKTFKSPLDGSWVLNSPKEGRAVPYSPREAALYSPTELSGQLVYSKEDKFQKNLIRLGKTSDHLLLSPIELYSDREGHLDEDKFFPSNIPEDENNWLQDADQDDMFLDDPDEGMEDDEMNKMVGSAVQTLRNSKGHSKEGAVSAVILGRITEEREQDLESNDTDMSSEIKSHPNDNSLPGSDSKKSTPQKASLRYRSLSWGGELEPGPSITQSSVPSHTSAVATGRPPAARTRSSSWGGTLEDPLTRVDPVSLEDNPSGNSTSVITSTPAQAPSSASKSAEFQTANSNENVHVVSAGPPPVKRTPVDKKTHVRSSSWSGETKEHFVGRNVSSSSLSSTPSSSTSGNVASTDASSSVSNKIPPLPPMQPAALSSKPPHSRLRANSWGGAMDDFVSSESLGSSVSVRQPPSTGSSRTGVSGSESDKRSRLPQLSVSVPSRAVPKMRVRSGTWGGVMDEKTLSPHLSPALVKTKDSVPEPSALSLQEEAEPTKSTDAAPQLVSLNPPPPVIKHSRRNTWGGETELSKNHLQNIDNSNAKINFNSQNSVIDDIHKADNLSSRAVLA